MLKYLLPLLLICSTTLAVDVQPTAKPYEPIVVTHADGATVQVVPWSGTVPRFLQEPYIKSVTPGSTVFCAPPGAYLVFDGSGIGIIIIEGTVPGPPPGPGPGPGPEPPPISSQVQEVSRQGAATLNDPETTASLITAMTNAVNQTRGSPLELQVSTVRSAIETTLLNRRGASRQKDWLQIWRKPVNDEAQKQDTSTNYIQLIEAVIAGLKQTTNTPPQEKTGVYRGVQVLFTTGPNCVWCDKWKVEVQPRIIRDGAMVVEKRSSGVPVPQFDIAIAGRGPVNHVGFMSISKFDSILSTLKR